MSPAPAAGALPRLLTGVGQRPMAELEHHLDVYGPLPDLRGADPERLTQLIERSGLRGHGGAAFPAGRKLRAVAARRRPRVVVANATEGEPASKKDRALLRETPHLVLDGAALAARAVGASQAVLAVCESDTRGLRGIARALEERHRRGFSRGEPEWQLVRTPDRYLSGQETALISLLNGGEGLPAFGPRPYQRGVRGRPTLVQNVETLAHMALIARHGAEWFRGLGTPAHPGSALLTVSGAVARPGVYEVEHGMALSELLHWVGAEPPQAVLVGGYFGSWLSGEEAARARLAGEELSAFGAALGSGVIAVLGRAACPVAETARVAAWFELESAGQCGPCVNGLNAIASSLARVAAGAGIRRDLADLERWSRDLRGRGACQHPDGAVRFVASALRVFAAEFADHAEHGPCARCGHPPVLPVAAGSPAERALAA
ncbi:MAG TPA: NADH-ubiquinone oxidoreductase-F iron-sulfur binding region domain-containing protein [Solirubrobacteraceae bacterium]|nr:NADH-ubiquinone oxidoreductase-F iron-sulfur binding region domain-containing protein [Solirubrobacteraceae bacterium]